MEAALGRHTQAHTHTLSHESRAHIHTHIHGKTEHTAQVRRCEGGSIKLELSEFRGGESKTKTKENKIKRHQGAQGRGRPIIPTATELHTEVAFGGQSASKPGPQRRTPATHLQRPQ